MSYITRCPACGTAFRVVPDQLKLSEGWVRCGNCQEVFDASASLQPWPVGDVPPSRETTPPPRMAPELVADFPVEEEPAPPAIQSTARAALAPDDVEFEFDPDWMESNDPARDRELPPESPGALNGFPPIYPEYEPAPEPAAERRPEPDAGPATGLPPEWVPDEEAIPPPDAFADPLPEPAPRWQQEPEPTFADEPGSPVEGGAVHSADRAIPVWPGGASANEAQDPAESLSFVRQAQRRAFWRRPGVRAAQGMLALALLVSLVLYWAVLERDRLAAWQPAWQPALQALCRPLGCELAPLQEIESVLIDSTALRRRSEGRYVFDVTLRNTGRWPVAVPALELTLTDIADQVLVRRVFAASDWVGEGTVLAPGADMPVRLELSLEALEARTMTGYRALLFYP